MSNEKLDELEIAKLAAFTAASLNQVDQSTIKSSSSGMARRIDPRNFIKSNIPQQPELKHRLVKDDQFVEVPKSRSVGREVIGTAPLDLESLLIPMPEGFATEESINVPTNSPPIQQPIEIKFDKEIVQQTQTNSISDPVQLELNKINKKINKIMKLLNKASNEK